MEEKVTIVRLEERPDLRITKDHIRAAIKLLPGLPIFYQIVDDSTSNSLMIVDKVLPIAAGKMSDILDVIQIHFNTDDRAFCITDRYGAFENYYEITNNPECLLFEFIKRETKDGYIKFKLRYCPQVFEFYDDVQYNRRYYEKLSG